VIVLAIAVFVVCCLTGPGGLLTTWHAADVSYYGQLGSHLSAGEVPYHRLYVEYPPGALPVFVAPSVDQGNYVELFKALMTVLGCIAICLTALAALSFDRSPGRLAVALAPLSVSPILLGSVVLNRFDVWAMVLAAAGLALLVRNRSASGVAGLALGIVTKIYSAAMLPVVAVYILRTAGRSALRRASYTLLAVVAVVMLPFAIVGPGGLAFSFYVQITRHLEIESFAGSVLLALDRLGLYSAQIVNGTPGSRDLAGTFPTVLGVVSGLVELGAIVLATWWFARGASSRARLLSAVAAALVGYIAFGKVLSPQYLVWLLPVVPLVRGRTGLVATGIFTAVLALTNLEFSEWDSINRIGPAVWVLLARNVLLVGLFAVLAWSIRRHATSEGDGVAFRACA
jgi:hypothetical protein